MYGWIWRHLPGPWPFKVLLMIAIAVIFVSVLFLYVFPWAEHFFPFLRVTVEEEPESAARLLTAWLGR